MKKILTIVALFLVVLIAAAYVILLNLDFNRYKPQVAQLVFDATGRKLTIEGDIDIAPGLRPTLVAENVSFENADWGSLPDLARVKRLEAQVAFLPLIRGKLDFALLVLVEPEVVVEFDSSGTSNFTFDTSSQEEESATIPPPPLIFSDIKIEKGLFSYKDGRSDLEFSVRIDSLEGQIEGFDKPLYIDFMGAFDEIPLSLRGTFGPIWAWVAPGYPLPANLTATSGGSTATIIGQLLDPINLKGLAFDITANGSSVAEIAGLAGISGIPELGAFDLKANVNDAAGSLAVETVDLQIGSRELLKMVLTGNVQDVVELKGVNLNFTANSEDSAALSRFGLPVLPLRGAFQVRAKISDPEADAFSASDLSVILEDHEVNGRIDLNLGKKNPVLSASLTSQTFKIGPLNLDFQMTGPVEKPAVKKLDFKLGKPDIAEIRLSGTVDDLIKLQGIKIDFRAHGKDLANLEKLTGQPLPVRGAFNAAGRVNIPVHKKLQIPNLKGTAGKNTITGSVKLDLSADQPLLDAKLSSPKPDLPSVLLPKYVKEGWARGLSQVRPVSLNASLEGFAGDLAIKKIDLQAGTLKSARLRLTGSVENLTARQGIGLNFSLEGNDLAKLKEITAQQYIFAPVPGQGTYAISGYISDPSINKFKVSNFKFILADIELKGGLDFDLAAQPPRYTVDFSTQKFNLKPYPFPRDAAYAKFNKINDLGPLKLRSEISVGKDGLALEHMDLQAGNEQLAALDVNGSIKSLNKQTGINLNFNIRGKEIDNLKKLTGLTIPLKGAYGLSGKLKDPAPKKYNLGDLKLNLGTNHITGSMDLNLSGPQTKLVATLSSPQFNLQPVTIAAIEPLTRIKDLGPLQLTASISDRGNKTALQHIDLTIGREQLIAVSLNGRINDLRVIRGMELDFSLQGQDLSRISSIGGPALPFTGPYNLTGRLIDPTPGKYKIPSLEAVWGENDLRGWIAVDFSTDRPYLSAELSSQKMDLRPHFEQPSEKSPAGKPATAAGQTTDRFFSSKPFELEGLKVIDADIKFRGNQILLPALAFDDNIIEILLENGDLRMDPFDFTVGGGRADILIDLRQQNTAPSLVVVTAVDQLDVGDMLQKLGYDRSLEGMLDGRINLSGQGVSPAELMAGLNGFFVIKMVDGQISSRHLYLIERYLGSGALRLLNPFKSAREFAPVSCLVNNIEITDGLADVKLLLDTDQTSILGIGDINLKTEELNLGIKPTPKKTFGVSFSLKELSQPFRLSGTLTRPSLGIDPGRTARTTGKLAGALALGPVGLAAFFGDVSAGKRDACPLALEGVAPYFHTSEGGEKGDQVSDKEGKKEKKSGGFFRRLFGK
jgi:uncharacterized protein involved in outer membrane biogenesis